MENAVGIALALGVCIFAAVVCARVVARTAASARHFPKRIRPYVDAELALARTCMAHSDSAAAFSHLERAHVLGQCSTREHVRVHWHMMVCALRLRRLREVAAQTFRIGAAALLSGLGLVPEGNTGGGNVSAIRRMPVPPDLAEIISAARTRPL